MSRPQSGAIRAISARAASGRLLIGMNAFMARALGYFRGSTISHAFRRRKRRRCGSDGHPFAKRLEAANRNPPHDVLASIATHVLDDAAQRQRPKPGFRLESQ